MWFDFVIFASYVGLEIFKSYITTKIYLAESNYVKSDGEQKYLDEGIRYAGYIQVIEISRWVIMLYAAFLFAKIVEVII